PMTAAELPTYALAGLLVHAFDPPPVPIPDQQQRSLRPGGLHPGDLQILADRNAVPPSVLHRPRPRPAGDRHRPPSGTWSDPVRPAAEHPAGVDLDLITGRIEQSHRDRLGRNPRGKRLRDLPGPRRIRVSQGGLLIAPGHQADPLPRAAPAFGHGTVDPLGAEHPLHPQSGTPGLPFSPVSAPPQPLLNG